LPEAPNIRLLLLFLLVFVFLGNARGSTPKDVRIEDYEGRQITASSLCLKAQRMLRTPAPTYSPY
jgi:hypothetical protein